MWSIFACFQCLWDVHLRVPRLLCQVELLLSWLLHGVQYALARQKASVKAEDVKRYEAFNEVLGMRRKGDQEEQA